LNRIRLAILFLFTALLANPSRAQFPPAPGTGPGLPETIEAIDAARVTTRILYITAHPDDESGAILTYLARGLHADVALLSITRGEGGQNALGPEQAPQLGLIRTQELLAATRGYGVKLYFTRAKDFGFSKTPEETEKIWGDPVLEDMVRVIREFRPNIVINGWGGVHGGHGHHQLSGIWTSKAVKLAADPKFLPGPQFSAWDDAGAEVPILDVERGSDNPKGYVMPVDEVSPLYGKSWREIGIDAFSNHRSQGISAFLSSPFLRRPLALKREDGKPFDPKILSKPLVKEDCSETAVDASLVAARREALALNMQGAVQYLAKAAAGPKHTCARGLPPAPDPAKLGVWQYEDPMRQSRIIHALELAAGLEMNAVSDQSELAEGEPFTVNYDARCRSQAFCSFQEPKLDLPVGWTPADRKTTAAGDQQFTAVGGPLPKNPGIIDLLIAEPMPIVEVRQPVSIGGYSFSATVPVIRVHASSTAVQKAALRIVPAYTLAVEPTQAIEVLSGEHKPFDVFLRVHSYSTKPANVSVGLDVPDGLQSSAPVEVHFDGVGDQYAKLTVTPPAKLEPGNFTITAYAKRGDEKFSTSLEPLPTMPSILWSEPAQTVVHAFDIHVPANLRVGYISAEGEMIPEALRRLGISVEMLDANALTFGDLSKFSAIVVGVRAYELRPELASANKRLLDYVSNGGTLVVQYNRDFVWNKFLPAPYHATIGNPTPRITDENAEVKFLKPDDPLLNTPNKITAADFQNWVQERGLYYWSDFDAKYTPLLSMHDPGEKDLNGGLVYTHLDKGVYIYTGLAFFRELPEGVPGAYRLFVNLLCASQSTH
jgi:LmbE family N-acetylglucosaminyl deacetylase